MDDKDSKQLKAYPEINILECKGCGRCVLACPRGLLHLSDALNERGYHFSEYEGQGCIGCALCFYTCPEPSAIAVHVPRKPKSLPEG